MKEFKDEFIKELKKEKKIKQINESKILVKNIRKNGESHAFCFLSCFFT